jgi:hypothetical protein
MLLRLKAKTFVLLSHLLEQRPILRAFLRGGVFGHPAEEVFVEQIRRETTDKAPEA